MYWEVSSDGIQRVRTGSSEPIANMTQVRRTGYWAVFLNIEKSKVIFLLKMYNNSAVNIHSVLFIHTQN